MATLELGSLSEHLEVDQIKAVRKALAEVGAPPLPADDHADAIVLDREIDDDVLTDFFDRLDANDASAEVYLPIDFEDVLEVDGVRVGSLHALILVLESLKEDYRTVIELRNLEGCSFAEIGKRMARTEAAAFTLHARAMVSLGDLLKEQGED